MIAKALDHALSGFDAAAMAVLLRRSGRGTGAISGAVLRTRAQRMLRALGLSRAELSIALCDDRFIRKLNRTHRNHDRVTDVLSFAMLDAGGLAELGRAKRSRTLLGDVVISIPTARRQAAEKGVAPVAEVTFLLAHGLLHLLGFDHETRAEERRMNAFADALAAAALSGTPRSVDRLGAARPGRPRESAVRPRVGTKTIAKSKR